MTTFTATADLSSSLVAVAPASPTAGLTLHVTAGDGGACFAQAAPFPVLLQSPTGRPTKATAELADVASVVGDVVTLANRGQYGTSAQPVAVGWVISAPLTAEMVQAIQAAVAANASAVTANTAAITSEATSRASADTALASGISGEASTRATADTTNATAITSEATARASAVTAEATARASADALLVPSSALGVSVATLVSGKLPASQLTVDAVEFQGVWNATSNSPTLADGTGNPGDLYRVSVAGSQNLGSGSVTYAVGDDVILDQALVWRKVGGGVAGALVAANNLSDLASIPTAKTNLALVKTDVGLGNVDNTSDVNKPVSTAQAAADAARPAMSGLPTAAGQVPLSAGTSSNAASWGTPAGGGGLSAARVYALNAALGA